MAFFHPHKVVVYLEPTEIKSKEVGLEGTQAGTKQWNGAAANTFCDVQGVFCLFVVLIFGPKDTPLTWNWSQQRGSADLSEHEVQKSQSQEAWVIPLLRQQNVNRAESMGRRLPVPLGGRTPKTAVLAGLTAKAELPGIAGKIDSFPFKNYKSSSSAHICRSWREKTYWKNFCLFLTCPDSDYGSS